MKIAFIGGRDIHALGGIESYMYNFVFCLPSASEGMSIALLEAMSYRLPVIASDIKADTDILGGNAVYVRSENVEDMEKAYKYCMTHDSELQSFIHDNYEKVASSYTWDKVAAQYLEYVDKILSD